MPKEHTRDAGLTAGMNAMDPPLCGAAVISHHEVSDTDHQRTAKRTSPLQPERSTVAILERRCLRPDGGNDWLALTQAPTVEPELPICDAHMPSNFVVTGLCPCLWSCKAWEEQGDAGDYAAAGISSTSRSMSGYQRVKTAPNSPSSVFTRVCSNTCAPCLDHCICCFLQNRFLTT